MSELSVYKAINAVQADLAKVGISKDRRNQQQGYNFRGIDEVYNALSPLLAKHGLVILPRVTGREVIERQTKSGGALFYVTVHVEFDFVASADGSKHTVTTYGEAMDSGDKATNKAMSAAYKYAAMQAFAIPTEGDNDADAVTHEVAASLRQYPAEPQGQGPGSIAYSPKSDPARDKLYARLHEAATDSMASLEAAWKGLTKPEQHLIGAEGIKALKAEASK